MVYSKPEIVVLGTTTSSIQGSKIKGLEPVPPQDFKNKAADSELDD